MKQALPYYLGALISLGCITACHDDKPTNVPQPPTEQQVKQELIKSHQMYVKQEGDEIDQYIKSHGYTMQTTKRGMHYMFLEHGKGQQPKVGDYATVSYSISLLDGTVCYDSKNEGPKQFKVGEDAVESGVHLAVEMMHVGDKALFIIPSYLAHGLVGDRDKIPPGAVVVYNITLLSVKNTQSGKATNSK